MVGVEERYVWTSGTFLSKFLSESHGVRGKN